VKQSWGHKIYLTFPPTTPAQAVSKECTTLQKLEYFGVSNVPKCIASCYDRGSDQTTMIMQPLFIGSSPIDTNPDTASIKGISSTFRVARSTATKKLATTVIQLLNQAHIVTTGFSDHSTSSLFSSQPTTTTSTSSGMVSSEYANDPEIQLLVNSDTGDILMIDFSESKELLLLIDKKQNGQLFSEKDLQLADRFLRSALALVPEDCMMEWRQVILTYLDNDDRNMPIHPQIKELLQKYSII